MTQHAPCITLEYDCTCPMPRTSTIPTLLSSATLPVCVSTARAALAPIAECTTSRRTAHMPCAHQVGQLTRGRPTHARMPQYGSRLDLQSQGTSPACMGQPASGATTSSWFMRHGHLSASASSRPGAPLTSCARSYATISIMCAHACSHSLSSYAYTVSAHSAHVNK